MSLQDKMFNELKEKGIFDLARNYAFAYSDKVQHLDVFPSEKNLSQLSLLDEALNENSCDPALILKQLHELGSPATTAQTGGRYFGFVTGGAIPVSIATKWLTDFWDQNGGLYLTSPINAKLESICEKWLKQIFDLPEETVAGFVSGTSMANLCGLAAARYRLLRNLDWDINIKGLNGAPKIRIIAHDQVHSSIKKTLALLGFGSENVEWIKSNEQGTISLADLPILDDNCLILLQAGNVNTGGFDAFSEICDVARQTNSWVHIDGAFGLWAGACKSLKHLTVGMQKANSWSTDGHKTLNTPYDCGIIMCKDATALVAALQTTADYLNFSEQREPIHYTPEMSKRARAIELWATLKYLGTEGIDEMVTGFHQKAKSLAKDLQLNGFIILNDVVFNQILLRCETNELTTSTLTYIQNSGTCWSGSSSWNGYEAIRISICSWATTDSDLNITLDAFVQGYKRAKKEIN